MDNGQLTMDNADNYQLSIINYQLFEKALINIYQKKYNLKTEIEPELFKTTFDALNLAVDKSFGNVEYGKPNFAFVNELKYNNAVFSAFKTHRQQNDLGNQLRDENGNLKSFSQFKIDSEKVIGKYNVEWLKTEYNTAVLRARQAANFKKFEADADLFPNLKWLESTSVNVREGHRNLWGIVKPINDPFWAEHFPGNLWNCKCGLTNTDEPADKKTPEPGYKPDIGLDENPAITAQIFNNDKNAYTKNAYLNEKELKAVATKKADEVFGKVDSKTIEANRKEYNQFDKKEYVKQGFDEKTGGFWVTHNDHSFDKKNGKYEKLSSEILMNRGNRIVLQSELSTVRNVKIPDGLMNDVLFDIKVINSNTSNSIKRNIENAAHQNAKVVVLYFNEFDETIFYEGIAKWNGLAAKLDYKIEIFYIKNKQLHKYK